MYKALMYQELVIRNAITEALREMERSPEDDIPTIWNEVFHKWELPFQMNNNFSIDRF